MNSLLIQYRVYNLHQVETVSSTTHLQYGTDNVPKTESDTYPYHLDQITYLHYESSSSIQIYGVLGQGAYYLESQDGRK